MYNSPHYQGYLLSYNFYEKCTESRLKQNCVMCPAINKLMDIGMCADNCDYYEGDGKDVEYMMCSYKVNNDQ